MSDRIYLAGPITGCTHDETIGWREEFIHRLKGTGIQCFSPMRGKDHLNLLAKEWLDGEFKDSVACSRAIMTRDRFDCSRATLVVANLLKSYMPKDARPSLGTTMELAWADANRIPIIAIIDKPEDSPYNHPMINEAIGFRVASVVEAVEMVKLILVSGRLWLQQFAFGDPLQPQLPSARNPLL